MTTCDLCKFTPKGVEQCALCRLTDACLEDVTVLDDVMAEQYPEQRSAVRRRPGVRAAGRIHPTPGERLH